MRTPPAATVVLDSSARPQHTDRTHPAGPPRRPPAHLWRLNAAQRDGVLHGAGQRQPPPLLVIAGAGTGKTTTLAHRVAQLVLDGAHPARILLLTFTRRAAREMTRRAERIVAQAIRSEGRARRSTAGRISATGSLRWAGTFHAIANRLLRLHGGVAGIDSSFTVLDRSDAEDLLDLVRQDLRLSGRQKRFPRKATCLAIYSRCVNSQAALQPCLDSAFPWCRDWERELRQLFRAYVELKQRRNVLDYDDLLLYWFHLMQEPIVAKRVSARFDHVLVDEYQDTNALQATILLGLCPDGTGLTVVGDDAQAIYSFRAASVRNILDFPGQFDPPAQIVTLERNYRSTGPILDAANSVIGFARERFTKDLFGERRSEQRPRIVVVEDEHDQASYVVERVLCAREAGVALRDQAVLFRTGHHSDLLEVELGRHDIPYVKYGGLRFLEAAHIKDLLSILRWAENPRDTMAAFRLLQLLPGIGPATARSILGEVDSGAGLAALRSVSPPAAAAADWPALVALMVRLGGAPRAGNESWCDGTGRRLPAARNSAAAHGPEQVGRSEWPSQVGDARRWYEPHLERLYDAPGARIGDLEQLELIAGKYPSRERFLTELVLDPPSATGDQAGPPHLDEDYLVLSTIHSAKGQEWRCVYVLNLVDGCIPSDMATGSADEIEEERRLLYVAMTRAKDELDLVQPLRFFTTNQHRHGDRHIYAPRSRFVPATINGRFEPVVWSPATGAESPQLLDRGGGEQADAPRARIDIGAKLRGMW